MQNNRTAFTVVELIVVVGIVVVMLAILAPVVQMTKERAGMITCERHLMALSVGLHRYAAKHRGAFPPDLGALYPTYVSDREAFDCPTTPARGTPEHPDYVYTAGLTESSNARTILVSDMKDSHAHGKLHGIRIDGTVALVSD